MALLALDERAHIARLFNFLIQGECLAHDCAVKQALLCLDPQAKRFLLNQARQEDFHRKAFKAGVGILAPKGVGRPLGSVPFQHYRAMLEAALSRGDLAESLLGMQIILEGFGEVTLARISQGFSSRGFAFHRVRHLVAGQEDAHHSFGLHYLRQMTADYKEIPPRLMERGRHYFALTDELMASVAALFEYFDEDAFEYGAALRQSLPAWITN